MRLLLTIASSILLCACTGAERFSSSELADIYVATLEGETWNSAQGSALDPYFISDQGTFEHAELMPDSVVRLLLDRALFGEVCERLGGSGQSDCVVQRARAVHRVSRPIPVGRDEVEVYRGRWSIRPQNDTATLYISGGMAERCLLKRLGGRWRRERCVETMVI